MIDGLNQHIRGLLAQVLDPDPDLDLRASAGPAILTNTAAICGKPIDPEAMADRLTTLLLAPTAPVPPG